MRTPGPFDSSAREYDGWYGRHRWLYESELAALKRALPPFSRALEIGVGTGRFASALGVEWGIDPARPMLDLARSRGCRVIQAVGENLPFGDGAFDSALMVTALCFVRDPQRAIAEARRVLRPDGRLVLGIIDPNSHLGREYRRRAGRGGFYAGVRFLSVPKVAGLLAGGLWSEIKMFQTLFPSGEEEKVQTVRGGYGEGAFVALSARKAF